MIFFRVGKIYAVLDGVHKGQLLCLIEKRNDKYGFLSIPDMVNHWIDKKDVDVGLKEGILESVDKPPKYVKNVAKAQFEQNEKDHKGGV